MRVFLLLVVMSAFSIPAFAQEVISKQAVTQYLDEMAALYTADQVDYAAVGRFLEARIDDNAPIVMRFQTNDESAQEVKEFTRQEMLDLNSQTVMDTLESQGRYRLHRINYDEELGTSVIIYTFWHDSKIRKTIEDGNKAILEHRMKANCQEFVRLDADMLKVFGSDCNIEVFYDKPYLEAP